MPTATRRRLGELLVPAIVLLGCLLYWLHVQDARSVARRVPDAVILFTVVLTAVVVIREMLFPREVSADEGGEDAAPAFTREDFIKRSLFVGLCVGYYFAFIWLGFNLANLAFLLLAYPLAGLGIGWSVAGAFASSAMFYGLARVMEFNVPIGPFGF